ncbi:MAG: cyclodeaminase/cyclohydrolase family protein [Candidatus Omnitrophica bacterium]|nr:cyclodeaminase/cyclohydrolase family protein [Candidatus Omnitrophota bacterium]
MINQKFYKDTSLEQYLDDLAARIAAPGGGSAAALVASCGQALVSMVINFTVGKPQYARFEKQLQLLLEKSEKLRHEFLALVDLDVQAFLSKDIRQAVDVPLMIARLAYEGMRVCTPLVKKGNKNLISDVAVAAVLLESAFSSAYYNVEINLNGLKDKELAVKIHQEIEKKKKAIQRMRKITEVAVGKIIRG